METLSAYIPMDRRQAIATGYNLPERSHGTVLFVDVSGFTALTEALVKSLGRKRAAEEITYQLNCVYEALITEIHAYQGSVIGFVGDAITCWFDTHPLADSPPFTPEQTALRAVACGLAMQQALKPFAVITLPHGETSALFMKIGIASGPVRRFCVGDPAIQVMDAVAGSTLQHMAAAEKHARPEEVVVDPATMTLLNNSVTVAEWRLLAEAAPVDTPTGVPQFAVIASLTQPVAPTPWPPLPPLTENQTRPWLLAPVYERLRLGQGQYLAELRPAVALFLRFGGLDYEQDDAAGDKLNRFICRAQQTLTRYGGYLIQLTIGDKGSFMYAAFGAPVAHDDDPARAAAAALGLQSVAAAMDFVADAQIGLTWGQMRTGAYGSQQRRTYGVISNDVNLAARLMGKAQPGQIMVSRRIAEAISAQFQLEYVGPIMVKGRLEPMEVSLLVGRRAVAQKPVKLYPTTLVGRDDELARLEAVLNQAAQGAGQIIRVEGEAGIGKSHLLAEFAGRAGLDNWRVVQGFCQSTSQDLSYYPWRQIFRALFNLVDERGANEELTNFLNRQVEQVRLALAAINPAWLVRLPLLADLLDLPITNNPTTTAFSPQLRREALFTLAVELIQQWSRQQPLLLLLEDMHWADEASLGLLLALARIIRHEAVVLTVAHRPPLNLQQPFLPQFDRLPYSHTLNLGELSPAGVAALAQNRLGGNPSAVILDLIQLQAKGNPFYVEELLAALREIDALQPMPDTSWTLSKAMETRLHHINGLIRNEAGQWTLNPAMTLSIAELGLADSVHGLVLSRLDRLPESHKLTLKVASVIGRIFDFRLLVLAHPIERDEAMLLEQIETVEGHEFVRLETPDPKLAHIFKHNITRDVAYETLLESDRRTLHAAVGQALEQLQPDAIEQLAHHFSRAQLQAKAMEYLDKAARKAQREYANETALSYYAQALALEPRWQWYQGQIEVLHILGRREEELVALTHLELLPDAPVFETNYLRGQYFEAVGENTQAQAAIESALQSAQNLGRVLDAVKCLTKFGMIAYKQGDYEQAKARYQQTFTLFQAEQNYSIAEVQAVVMVLNGQGVVYRQQGYFDKAFAAHTQALKLSRQYNDRQGEAQTLNDLGVTALYQRDFAGALDYYRQALKIRQAIGDRAGEGATLGNLAQATRDAGDYDQAQHYLSASLDILQAIGNRWGEVNVWNDLGIMYQEMGDYEQAQQCLQQGLQVCREIDDEIGEAYLMANIGLVAYDSGNFALAEKVLREGVAIANKHNDSHILAYLESYLGLVCLAVNRLDEAITQANAALKLHQESNMLLFTADDWANLATAYLADNQISQALNYAQQALSVLDGCGGEGPEFPQRDYFICYRVLQAAGFPEPAQDALQSAYNLVISRAEKITDPALRQSFLERVPANREIVAAYINSQHTQ